jgi:hypothetical protein
MFQIVESYLSTATSFVDTYRSQVIIGVLVVVGAGIAWKVLHRVLSGGGSDRS